MPINEVTRYETKCDFCGLDGDDNYMYISQLTGLLTSRGWQFRNEMVACPECWTKISKFIN